MKEFIKLEDEIKDILIKFVATRNDDMYLYYVYCILKFKRNLEFHSEKLDFERIFSNPPYRKILEIATFGAVERCRRKIQASCPELSSERAKKARAKKEKEFREYARL